MNRRNALKTGIAAAVVPVVAKAEPSERVEDFEGQAFLESEANRLKGEVDILRAGAKAIDDELDSCLSDEELRKLHRLTVMES